MTYHLSTQAFRLLRLQAQRLLPASPGSESDAAWKLREVAGVQAQDLPAAQLAVHVRAPGVSLAEIERARQESGDAIHTWAMRGTLHLLSREDARWMIPLMAPVFIASSRYRMEQLGWDEENTSRGLHLLEKALSDRKAITRAEIISLLKENALPWQGQAPVHLLYRAAWEGFLIQGPDRGKKPAYLPAESWMGSFVHLPALEAAVELGRRYLHAFAPATLKDLAAWSGLPIVLLRQAWQELSDEIFPVVTGEQQAWMLKSDQSRLEGIAGTAPAVVLLARFDNLLLGYASREWTVEPQFATRFKSGGGIISPTWLVDGKVRGIWRPLLKPHRLEVTFEPFEELNARVRIELEAQASRLGTFFGKETTFK